ncbi:hypothetical protein LJ756_00050 [Arthrobacter sp. zg-Y411]|uniref:ATP-grasp fold amidoligase family protein n=1 Tax=Arthrobacter zhangbolii TaxID=2886936 RepID=UPI001D159AF1|nr:ATP-grasp fold amidoligase family protein [Arthrobacter zhangbolii]MCC3293012.1 hypothetical protein [Arthrobacter zhangbolii]
MDYFDHMQLRLTNQEKYVPGRLGDKKLVRQFADMIGVRTPSVYFRGALADIQWGTLPREFVLKPAFASTSIGVMLLRTAGEGKYDDLTGGPAVTVDQIKEKCAAISTKFYNDAAHGDFIIEELLRDEDGQTPPQDIRFYAFQGEIGMILKEDHMSNGAAKAMYFDGNFLPFSDVHSRYSVAQGMEAYEEIVEAKTPHNWRELLSVAKRISSAVPSAFCRIDLYDTSEGVYLGEITFYPGTFYYKNRKLMSQNEAERLGRMWDVAAERLAGSHDPRSLSQAFTTGPTT